ncbi:hypothetical protein B0H12DRAFT_1241493 [Mycena haematopus]|nr:hypothetical protein B0H12DRAFT_1241493 [Mycena haematopus]
MRTGTDDVNVDADEVGDSLFPPQQSEMAFQYPGNLSALVLSLIFCFQSTPIPSLQTPPTPPPHLSRRRSSPTLSPDAMLRAYAAKHASVTPSLLRAPSANPSLSRTHHQTRLHCTTTEVVPSVKDTWMRVLCKQIAGEGEGKGRAASPGLIWEGWGQGFAHKVGGISITVRDFTASAWRIPTRLCKKV